MSRRSSPMPGASRVKGGAPAPSTAGTPPGRHCREPAKLIEKEYRAMIRFGMHSSLWSADWTPEAAELAVPEAAKYGLELIEVSLLNPGVVDVAHSRALFKEYGVAPSGSLCLPMEVTAPHHPKAAEAFLMSALDV